MLDNIGDSISFIPDQYNEKDWLINVNITELAEYKDLTDLFINKAEKEGFIKGRTKIIVSDEDPDIFYWKFDPSDF